MISREKRFKEEGGIFFFDPINKNSKLEYFNIFSSYVEQSSLFAFDDNLLRANTFTHRGASKRTINFRSAGRDVRGTTKGNHLRFSFRFARYSEPNFKNGCIRTGASIQFYFFFVPTRNSS